MMDNWWITMVEMRPESVMECTGQDESAYILSEEFKQIMHRMRFAYNNGNLINAESFVTFYVNNEWVQFGCDM